MKRILVIISAVLLTVTTISFAGDSKKPSRKKLEKYFGAWTKEQSPLDVGKRLAQHFIESPHFNYGLPIPPKYIRYPEVCTWYGALRFADASGNKEMLKQLAERFEPIFNTERDLIPFANHVDNTVFGSVPLELYIQTKEKRYLELGQSIADQQWTLPDSVKSKQKAVDYFNRGLTWQTRMWIDDMFMITAVQSQAYRATKNQKYIDRAAKEMVVYLDSLQQPNGLFYHAPDVPFFWGRGDGWMAAGMSILLKELPKNHPNRARIMEGYKKMMAILLKYQDEKGMWHQLIDKPELSWPETSCTGMFTFAFISGVKSGMLDAKLYAPAARKGWLSLISYIDEKADIHEVCEGTNKKNDLQYYLDRKRNIGDMHGQAPVLWCASALLK
jgi:unsaturated rhamnogalacturonyl hydrolase